MARGTEQWNTEFHNSRKECYAELQRLRQKIAKEEELIIRHVRNVEEHAMINMDKEYRRLKKEINAHIDQCYEVNKAKVIDTIRRPGSVEYEDIKQVRSKLNSIRANLDAL